MVEEREGHSVSHSMCLPSFKNVHVMGMEEKYDEHAMRWGKIGAEILSIYFYFYFFYYYVFWGINDIHVSHLCHLFFLKI